MGAKRTHDKTLPTGIYRVRGRFQIAWMDHGKRQRELLKAGTSLDRAVRLRSRKLDEVEDGTPTTSASNKVTYDRVMEAYNRKLEAAHKDGRHYPQLNTAFHGRRAGRSPTPRCRPT